jgi:hypothetical protein
VGGSDFAALRLTSYERNIKSASKT